MPELPEVESIKLQLEKFLSGHKIEDVEVKNKRIFPDNEKQIIGAKFKKFHRFGKVIIMDLSNGFSLMAHVKMTGQFIYNGPNLKNPAPLSKKVVGGVPGPHTRVIFKLDKGGVLYYNDFRAFGWIKIVKTEDATKTGLVGKMGPEPHRDLTLEKFIQILSKTKRPVKVVLMDQERMSGVGNIYANDALWLSKIDPKRPSQSINEKEVKALYKAVHDVLKEGLKYGGSSENSYVTPDGQEGEYQRHTLVYGKQGQLCSRCKKEKISKYMLGGRGTYVCSFCQA
jgi:formamidopyrimidine-DNA glycosylase